MAIADKLINTYKQGVDAAALVNKASVDLLVNTSLQNKCAFEILIYPKTFPKTISGKALTAIESLIMRTYLYSIEDIILTGFEYQRSGEVQWVKDLIYPESVTMTFLEIGLGVVKSYLRKWMDEVAVNIPMTMDGVTHNDYVFNDDQESSKRNAIIIPMQSDVIPSSEWIYIEGMKFKNVGGISYDHSSPDFETLVVQFTCDSVISKGKI